MSPKEKRAERALKALAKEEGVNRRVWPSGWALYRSARIGGETLLSTERGLYLWLPSDDLLWQSPPNFRESFEDPTYLDPSGVPGACLPSSWTWMAQARAREDSRGAALQGVLLVRAGAGTRAIASDGHRIHAAVLPDISPPHSGLRLMDRHMACLLRAGDFVTFGKHIHAALRCSADVIPAMIKAVTPKAAHYPTTTLLEFLDRPQEEEAARVNTKELRAAIEAHPGPMIVFAPREAGQTANLMWVADGGDTKNYCVPITVAVKAGPTGPRQKTYADRKYLLDALPPTKETSIVWGESAHSPIRFRAPNFSSVVMPIGV